MSAESGLRVIELEDERSALAIEAVGLIEETFDSGDRHSADELRSQIAEQRLGLLAPFHFHLLVACEGATVLGVAIGTYLAGVNAGLVNYLAVLAERRGHGIGRLLRPKLVASCRADAALAGHGDLAWMLGEVRAANPWLRRLVRNRGAIPFDITYYHPGMRPPAAVSYVLYRQPVADTRVELPAELVRRILYAIYRRSYRVRYPLQHPGFAAMIAELEERVVVGAHADFEYPEGG